MAIPLKENESKSVSHSVVSNSLQTLWTVALQAPLHGILQVKILEWVAIPSAKGSSPPRD